MFEVHTARREKQKAIVGLIGASGSGKTAGALLLALGMMRAAYPDAEESTLWSKIGVADTEHKRSNQYADVSFGQERIGGFQYVNFTPPYNTDNYIAAVESLKKAGAEVVIIDSLSHHWFGEGGVLEQHSKMGGNSFKNWDSMSEEIKNLIKMLTHNNVHIICTLRTKQEYGIEMNEHGRMQPVKLGTKPIQKAELEYEFMLNFSLDMNNKATATKDNTMLFKDEGMRLSPEVGEKLYKWLEHGVDVAAEEEEERQKLLHKIDVIVTVEEDKRKILDQIEFKMGKKVAEFELKHVKLAYERLQ